MSLSISGMPTQQVYNPQPIKKRPQPDFSLEDDEAFYVAQRRVKNGQTSVCLSIQELR